MNEHRRRLKSTFRALKQPNYRLFWGGQLVSLTGTWMQTTAMAWLVLHLTNSPLALGTVSTVQFTPILLFALFGGVIADRFPKRRILVATQSVMMAQALALAILISSGAIQLWQIYVLAAVQGLANALDNPTRQSFVVEMVGPQDLPNAIALNSSQFQLSRLAGPALSGVLIPTVGLAACFYFNAASFVAVIASLTLMNAGSLYTAARRPGSGGHVLREIREGIRYAISTPDIALAVLIMAVIGTFGYNFQVIMPLIARYVLHSGALGFGLLSSAVAAGSLAATLTIAYIGRATRRMLFMGASVFSLSLFAVGLSTWWLITIPLLVVLGFASSVFTSTNNSRLQLVTPPHLRGRVMSINTLLFMGSTPVGSLIIGFLAHTNGVQATVAELGAICILGVVAGAVYARRLRDRLLPEDQIVARAAGSQVEPAAPMLETVQEEAAGGSGA